MYRFKGFVEITTLISNANDVVAAIGEISPRALSFAKDIKRLVGVGANKEVTVLGFSSKASASGSVTIPTLISSKAVIIAEWIHTRQKTIASNETKADFLSAFNSAFSGQCVNVSCGEMTVASNGKPYPTFIRWKSADYAGEDNLNTLWLSDAAFQSEYDDYEIVVVPPLTNIDSFFNPYGEVLTSLGEMNMVRRMEAIQNARGRYPETIVTAESFNFYNQLNPTVKVSTDWAFLIYGPKGNDADALKEALINYLTVTSSRGISPWKIIFPDIFKSTEFIFVPKWHEYAIEEMVLQSGIYSPIMNPYKDTTYLKAVVNEYSPIHVERYMDVMAHPYKSLMLLVIGNAENRDNKYAIRQVFPDILAVSSTSFDFNRMSETTKKFLLILSEMIAIAETLTQSTDIPAVYKRSERNGVLYITATIDNVRYMVASKLSTPTA